MSGLFSPWTIIAASILVVVGVLASPNIGLWFACLLAFAVAVWLLGGRHAHRVLLWVIAINWLSVIFDVINFDLTNDVVSEGSMGTFRVQAILCSLCAVLALALGMRLGAYKSGWRLRPPVRTEVDLPTRSEPTILLNRVVICYFVALLLTTILSLVPKLFPPLTQPVLALGLLKYVCIYLVAAAVFEAGRGYYWLVLISPLEMITGLTGYFSTYKEAFIVMLLALASSRRRVSVRMWVFAVPAAIAVIWVSLAWTVVKKEYRHQQTVNAAFDSLDYKTGWIIQRMFFNDIDYNDAIIKLTARIGYTGLYARSPRATGSWISAKRF